MSDVISRQAAIDVVENIRDCMSVEGYWAIVERLKGLPSAQPERKKGKWEWSTLPITGALEQKCSICGTPFYMAFRLGMNYCPNCGADMRGENDGE